MNDIVYSYEIINVNPATKTMEVIYTSTNRQTMHIGTRMPYVGESVESVVRMYAPIAYWREQEMQVIEVNSSITGTIDELQHLGSSIDRAKYLKLLQLAERRYTAEISGISLNGSTIRTDRESQATISGAYTSLKEGLLTSIDFKTATGVWVTLSLAEMEPIARAVAQHVQSCFTLEKQLAEQVEAATTIEEVEAIAWPT